jgi:hypothetical protein
MHHVLHQLRSLPLFFECYQSSSFLSMQPKLTQKRRVVFKVKSELPSTLKVYRYQQHRWSCGPANLFRKTLVEIVRNKVPCTEPLLNI